MFFLEKILGRVTGFEPVTSRITILKADRHDLSRQVYIRNGFNRLIGTSLYSKS